LIPGSIFRCVPGAAHSIHVEAREVFVKAVHEFLTAP
jgi:pimeloyl-ACP methyl ester carboxylesterase